MCRRTVFVQRQQKRTKAFRVFSSGRVEQGTHQHGAQANLKAHWPGTAAAPRAPAARRTRGVAAAGPPAASGASKGAALPHSWAAFSELGPYDQIPRAPYVPKALCSPRLTAA